MQLESVESEKPQPRPQPFAFGVIPIGPALSRLGMRRAGDQDPAGKGSRMQEEGSADAKGKQQRSTGGRVTSGEVGAKFGRGRRGTVGPDSLSRLEKPAKGAANKLGASPLRFPGCPD